MRRDLRLRAQAAGDTVAEHKIASNSSMGPPTLAVHGQSASLSRPVTITELLSATPKNHFIILFIYLFYLNAKGHMAN